MNKIRRSKEQWQQLVQKQLQSGLNIAEFCRQNQLDTKYFYKIQKDFQNKEKTTSAFVQVKIDKPTGSTLMSINMAGAKIDFYTWPQVDYVGDLLKVCQ